MAHDGASSNDREGDLLEALTKMSFARFRYVLWKVAPRQTKHIGWFAPQAEQARALLSVARAGSWIDDLEVEANSMPRRPMLALGAFALVVLAEWVRAAHGAWGAAGATVVLAVSACSLGGGIAALTRGLRASAAARVPWWSPPVAMVGLVFAGAALVPIRRCVVTWRWIPGSRAVAYRLLPRAPAQTLRPLGGEGDLRYLRLHAGAITCLAAPRLEQELWLHDGYAGCLAVVREGGEVRMREVPPSNVALDNRRWAARHRADVEQTFRDDPNPDQAWKLEEERLADRWDGTHSVSVDHAFLMDLDEVTAADFAAWLDEQRGAIAPGNLGGEQVLVQRASDNAALGQVTTRCAPAAVPSGDEYAQTSARRCAGYRAPIWLDRGRYKVCPGRESEPAALVSWVAADAFCRARGGRLPTDDEWVVAARGPGPAARMCPWGDTCEPYDDVVVNMSTAAAPFSDTLLHRARYGGRDVSFYGARNMLGGLQEWLDGDPAERPARDAHPELPRRPLRGSAWTLQDHFFYVPGSWYEALGSCELGFRCVRDVRGAQ